MAPPKREHPIDARLAAQLIADQHPDLAHLPLRPAAEGWDNAMYRLGEDLAVRLPRRALGAELIGIEQRWLPLIAPALPLATPAPVRTGQPGRGYPWRWSIVRWIPGATADRTPLAASEGARWGAFLKALHRPAPTEAPFNPYRSVPLAKRAEISGPQLARVAAARPDLVTPAILTEWRAALVAEVDRPAGWIHGDLHGRNVLAQDGRLTGVIDWGDMASGDPAMDLYSVWILLPDRASREAALAAYGSVSSATRARARGWAIAMAATLIDHAPPDDPDFAAMGERTFRALVEGP
ncbi:aminoglycoside phosphotransferase family protein [Phenylobacterium soli]|uniref:Phosphotransferase n=1 Tax=Phenylobacterium soli TaxID=2170551 RepID=A0A328AN74_9CAUL|nr:aminoglycoside phosphotransferase family protein [Phenylobacterium soli]RAK54358.1 phosphotransferase [Phenylobacterium soli]